MTTIRIETDFKIENCYFCGTPFGLEKQYIAARRRDHGTFYCPNGHGQIYTGTSDADLLAEERRKNSRLVGQLDQAKAELKEKDNRAKAGDCPLCGKHVYQLERHMKRQHSKNE